MSNQSHEAAQGPRQSLSIRGLAAGYPGVNSGGGFKLREISLEVPAGKITGILGPNGSGKSTLLMALAGLTPVSAGEALWDGRAIITARSRPSARKLARLAAVLPQKYQGMPELTALEIALMGRYAHTGFGGYGRQDVEAAKRSLAETGCAHLEDRLAQTLSGGELQRVLLARALAQEAPILLLDEPSSSLDPGQGPAIFGLLRALAREKGRCVLCAMHDLNLAALYCDQLLLLKNGAPLAQGKTEFVFTAHNLNDLYDAPFNIVAHPCGASQALYSMN